MNLISFPLFLKVIMFHEILELKKKNKKQQNLVIEAKIFSKVIREVRKFVLCYKICLETECRICLHESYEALSPQLSQKQPGVGNL